MTHFKLPALASLLAALIFSPSAFADDGYQIEEVEQIKTNDPQRSPRPGKPVTTISPAALLLASFDANHDYVISAAEIEAGLARTFEAVAKDNRKYISIMELQDWRRKALGSQDASPHLFAFDPNLDQRITREEFSETFQRAISYSDKNEDGDLTYSELVHIVEIPQRRVDDEDELRRIRQSRIDRDNRGYGRR